METETNQTDRVEVIREMNDLVPGNEQRVLRVGVIGAGGHACDQIYPSLYSLPVELAAICDLDESRATRAARTFGAEEIYTDHLSMLNGVDLDAAIVCVGANEHPKLAIDVMEAGVPVWTEKPPAPSAQDTLTMLEASRRTSQICMTGFMKRFAPVYQRARSAIQSPEFGSPCLLTADWCFGVDDKSWLDMFFLDFGIHMVDLTRYMFGEVVEVHARERLGIAYAITMLFENGAIGTMGMTANRGYDITERIDMTGDYGNVVKIDSGGRMVSYRGGKVVDWYDRPLAMQDSLVDIGYVGELAEFINAIIDAREPESSIANAYQTMRLYEAICQSAQGGGAVRLVGDL